jgi:hypothetical protein
MTAKEAEQLTHKSAAIAQESTIRDGGPGCAGEAKAQLTATELP